MKTFPDAFRWLSMALTVGALHSCTPRSQPAADALLRAPGAQQGVEAFSFSDIQVLLVRRPLARLVSVELLSKGGTAYYDSTAAGIEWMLAQLLPTGTTQRTAGQLRERLDELGAQWQPVVGPDYAGLRLVCLAENLTPAFHLLAEAFLAPSLQASEVQRVRQQALLAANAPKSPQQLLDSLARRSFWAGQPYAVPLEGMPATLEFIGPNELREHHLRLLNRSRLCLVVSGPVEAETLANLLFGRLDELPLDVETPLAGPNQPKQRLLRQPGAQPAWVQALMEAPAAGSPEAAALEVALDALLARLVADLCLRRSLCCQLDAAYVPCQQPHARLLFVADQPALVLRYVKQNLADLMAQLDERELAQARERLLLRHHLATGTVQGMCGFLASQAASRTGAAVPGWTPPDPLAAWSAVTPDDARKALKKATQSLHWNYVGDETRVLDSDFD